MDSYNTYDPSIYNASPNADPGLVIAAAMSFMLAYLVFVIAIYVVMAIFLGKIFKKAGTPSWIAWVPVYNTWKILEIGGQKGWWALLAFIPIIQIASIVFMFIAMYNIGKKLGKEDWFILVAIFLSPVWVIWLGADSSTWDESKGAPRVDTPVAPVAQATPTAPAADQSVAAPAQPVADDTNNQTPPTAPTVQ